MRINNENINIDDLISQKYMHKEIKKGIFLSDYQLEVLEKYNIDINQISSINELIFTIEEILEEEDYDDLSLVCDQIMEYSYYANTNK